MTTIIESVGISWTEAVQNSIYGCTKCSTGCSNCYALRNIIRFDSNQKLNCDGRFTSLLEATTREIEVKGVTKHEHVKELSGAILFNPAHLYAALQYKAPKLVFVDEFGDLYHDCLPIEIILEHFRVFQAVPHCLFQILTKRADRLAEIDAAVREEFGEWPANVAQGVSICAPTSVEMSRIDKLGATGAKIKWISAEPWISAPNGLLETAYPDLHVPLKANGIGGIVVGGESGSKKHTRMMTLEDARYWISAGRKAGCFVHFKQLGVQLAVAMGVYSTKGQGEHRAKGGNLDQIPEDLRVRELPPIPKAPIVQPVNFVKTYDPNAWLLFGKSQGKKNR